MAKRVMLDILFALTLVFRLLLFDADAIIIKSMKRE